MAYKCSSFLQRYNELPVKSDGVPYNQPRNKFLSPSSKVMDSFKMILFFFYFGLDAEEFGVPDVGYCIGRQRYSWRWTAGRIEAVYRVFAWHCTDLLVNMARLVATVRVMFNRSIHACCRLTSRH